MMSLQKTAVLEFINENSVKYLQIMTWSKYISSCCFSFQFTKEDEHKKLLSIIQGCNQIIHKELKYFDNDYINKHLES